MHMAVASLPALLLLCMVAVVVPVQGHEPLPPKAPATRVILLAHSHEDPGWTNTIEQYYEGGYEYKHYVRPNN